MPKPNELTEGQRAYEAKRAAKAGMSLEKWLAEKDKRARAEAAETAREAQVAKDEAKPKGWFGRLLDKAHQPLK
jgi:membrane protein involved in colicin uptake